MGSGDDTPLEPLAEDATTIANEVVATLEGDLLRVIDKDGVSLDTNGGLQRARVLATEVIGAVCEDLRQRSVAAGRRPGVRASEEEGIVSEEEVLSDAAEKQASAGDKRSA